MGKVNVYDVGGGGVNLVKNPLQMGDNESTQLQNAEFIPDQSSGGQGALSKRGGLQALNSSSLGGAISGMAGLPLQTTFTRTLYAGLGQADSDKWGKTTNGTSWTFITTPAIPTDLGNSADSDFWRLVAQRAVSFKTSIYYSGDFDDFNAHPNIYGWDNNISSKIVDIYPGPDSNTTTFPYAIKVVDMLAANQKIYIAVLDRADTAIYGGRVLVFDPIAGTLSQVANTVIQATGSNNYGPTSLCWYQDQLWLSVMYPGSVGSNGRLYRCYPDVDTAWTADVTNLGGQPLSMAEFGGDLYVGTACTNSPGTATAYIYKRTAATGAYSIVYTGDNTDGAHIKNLTKYNSELYAVEFNATTLDYHIKKSSNGTAWSTDRDMDASDGINFTINPTTGFAGNMLEYNSDLYLAMQSDRSTVPSAGTDGFILRKSSGTWSKVSTDNYQGTLAVLVERT